jgi:hypothetical protein
MTVRRSTQSTRSTLNRSTRRREAAAMARQSRTNDG